MTQNLEEIDKDTLKNYIYRLYEYCDVFDSDEIESTAKEACSYIYNGIDLSKYFLVIYKYASSFKYEEVVEVLDKMIKDLRLEIRR